MTDPQMQARARQIVPGLSAVMGGNLLLLGAHGLRAYSDEVIFGLSGAFWRGVLTAVGIGLSAGGVALLVAAIARVRGAGTD